MVEGFTHASSVIAVVSCSEAELGMLTRALVPLNDKRTVDLPAVVHQGRPGERAGVGVPGGVRDRRPRSLVEGVSGDQTGGQRSPASWQGRSRTVRGRPRGRRGASAKSVEDVLRNHASLTSCAEGGYLHDPGSSHLSGAVAL